MTYPVISPLQCGHGTSPQLTSIVEDESMEDDHIELTLTISGEALGAVVRILASITGVIHALSYLHWLVSRMFH